MAEHMNVTINRNTHFQRLGLDVIIPANHRGHKFTGIDESTRGHYDDMKRVIGDALK